MTPIKGKCEAFFETGTGGTTWSVYEDGKEGYNGLHILKKGDNLTIFHPENPGLVIWEGNIDLEWERNYRSYPSNPQYGQQSIDGRWVHGIQRDVIPHLWGKWFFKQYPCELRKNT